MPDKRIDALKNLDERPGLKPIAEKGIKDSWVGVYGYGPEAQKQGSSLGSARQVRRRHEALLRKGK